MHARYVLVWFAAGLVALLLAALVALASRAESALLLAAALDLLALGLALGLLPAFARRDWPSPLLALGAVGLAALALAFLWHPRAFPALVGAALVAGALQPLALLWAPRWEGRARGKHLPVEGAGVGTWGAYPRDLPPFAATDAVSCASLALSLALTLGAGLLLVALPRGLPNAALALLVPAALAASIGALLFVLPREAQAPLPLAILGGGALLLLAGGAAGLAWAFARPLGADFGGPSVALAASVALASIAFARVRGARGGLAGAFALALLAPIALLLATWRGLPNALIPAAFFAFAALALATLAAAYARAAPLLLPGRARGGRWPAWSAALFVAALFLYTPALQYGRGVAPAAIAAAAGVGALVWGLGPLVSSAPGRMRAR